MSAPARRTRLMLGAALVLAACPAKPEPIDPGTFSSSSRTTPSTPAALELLFAAGRYGEVVAYSTQALAKVESTGHAAHLRLLRALARLSQHARSDQERGLTELRELELEFPDLVWGRMAALYVAQLTRADVLHESMLQAGVELRQLQDRIRVLEAEIADARSGEAHRQAKLSAIEGDREQLRKQLDEVQIRATAQVRRIAELEEELAALKRIDMQREP